MVFAGAQGSGSKAFLAQGVNSQVQAEQGIKVFSISLGDKIEQGSMLKFE
jgi:hypothetical protein